MIVVGAAVVSMTAVATFAAGPAPKQSAPAGLYEQAHRVAVKFWREMNYKQRFVICWQLDHQPRRLARSIKDAAYEPGGAFAGLNRHQQVVVWRAARTVFKADCR